MNNPLIEKAKEELDHCWNRKKGRDEFVESFAKELLEMARENTRVEKKENFMRENRPFYHKTAYNSALSAVSAKWDKFMGDK
jgi:hypothetical protein